MKPSSIICALFLCYIQKSTGTVTALGEELYYSYYWRDYNGHIPDDAIPGGHDSISRTTYIGQGLAYSSYHYGIIPTELVVDQTTAYLPLYGVEPVTTNIKILCGSPTTAGKWLSTSTSNFLLDVVDKQAVRGGIEISITNGVSYNIYVGRTEVDNQLIVGKIVVEDAQNVLFIFVHKGVENASPIFEALIYE